MAGKFTNDPPKVTLPDPAFLPTIVIRFVLG
jgi:hypothetical protein